MTTTSFLVVVGIAQAKLSKIKLSKNVILKEGKIATKWYITLCI